MILTVPSDIMGAGWDPSPFGWGTTAANFIGKALLGLTEDSQVTPWFLTLLAPNQPTAHNEQPAGRPLMFALSGC